MSSRAYTNIRLFLSSYAPLFVLFGIRLSDTTLMLELIAFGIVSASWVPVAFREARRIQPRAQAAAIMSVSNRGGEVAGYLVTYLLPLLTVTTPTSSDWLAYTLFVALVGVIYVRTDMIHINPLLYLFGFRVFDVVLEGGQQYLVITRRNLVSGDSIQAAPLRSNLIIET
jgi:hypothetical protein